MKHFNDLDWRTNEQIKIRLNWLMSLGFVGEEYGIYFLTDKELEVVEPAPAPPPPEPIDECIKHSTALIEKHPTMSESIWDDGKTTAIFSFCRRIDKPSRSSYRELLLKAFV